jgi:hypothetical protein
MKGVLGSNQLPFGMTRKERAGGVSHEGRGWPLEHVVLGEVHKVPEEGLLVEGMVRSGNCGRGVRT